MQNIEYEPIVNTDTIDELATLYQCGEIEITDIPDDIASEIINLSNIQ